MKIMKSVLAMAAATAVLGQKIELVQESAEELAFQQAFTSFVQTHSKEYPIEEVFQRYNTFKANQALIDAHNAKEDKTFTMAMNHFGDLTAEEMSQRHTGLKMDLQDQSWMANVPQAEVDPSLPTMTDEADPSIDWREKGAVTPVKNQGHCGSCWAFSATGGAEGAVAVATGKLESLSEQQLADCATENHGCHGGNPALGFKWIIEHGGITSEAAYPYVADNPDFSEPCREAPSVSQLKTFGVVKQNDENALLQALHMSPVSVGIDAQSPAFQFYSGGVFTGDCGQQLDHGVLAVAFGKDEATGLYYWVIKNSWGPQWGDQGYIKLVAGQFQCGIGMVGFLAQA